MCLQAGSSRSARCRGEVSDYVLMEQRGFGFVTYADPAHAQAFLEVCAMRAGIPDTTTDTR